MNRIDLTKYGFTRSKEEDFSDDGSRFTCYRAGKIRVSKCSYGDEVFIAGRWEGNGSRLDYEEYSKLPHYQAMDSLNGVGKESLAEEDLERFYQDCLAYEAEYQRALDQVVYPTVEEIASARRISIEARRGELADITDKISKNVDKLLRMGSYDYSVFQRRYNEIKRKTEPEGTDEEYAKNVYGSLYSRSLTNPAAIEMSKKPSWEYEKCLDSLKAVGIA